ncbi:type II toxin-antitoxin system RelE/ParE family toxin [Aeoliella mucimassa]|uniref:Plasmid stabilization system protein n=1 Tax=Aeoliella mucimassa TaxID=2527972 RepID=A0A518AT35_9BACT|nr:type II toxin-antitoxin system RelE/ParE family toxin [Aeoliella mucimassa]QDU57866.1 Plasmid stabilization system protein [Aeoliella mucimassa]
MVRVVITQSAARDIQAAYDWWSEHRSKEQANRWYLEIFERIASLKESATRYPAIQEEGLRELGLRQLLFGIGRRPTHRIILAINDQQVTVLRVRHVAQQDLESDEF